MSMIDFSELYSRRTEYLNCFANIICAILEFYNAIFFCIRVNVYLLLIVWFICTVFIYLYLCPDIYDLLTSKYIQTSRQCGVQRGLSIGPGEESILDGYPSNRFSLSSF